MTNLQPVKIYDFDDSTFFQGVREIINLDGGSAQVIINETAFNVTWDDIEEKWIGEV